MSHLTQPRVVMIPTARPTFVTEVAKERSDAARRLVAELGAAVSGPSDLVMTPDDTEAAKPFLAESSDLVINVCASFSDASPAIELYSELEHPLLLWSFREPGPVGDRLWLNSMCGANLMGHALRQRGVEVRLVYGDPDEPETRETLRRALAGDLPEETILPEVSRELADALTVQDNLAQLSGRRIGIIGDAPNGFTPSQFDPLVLQDIFGLSVDAMSVDDAFAAIRQIPADVRRDEYSAVVAARPSISQIDSAVVETHAAVTAALRSWYGQDGLSAIALRCWPEFPTELGVCPCSSLSRIADEGVPTVCERDVYGAVTMMLCEALGSGTTYLVDTVDLDAEANIVRLWHCGSAATSLVAEDSEATQALHCNRKIGVAGNFPLKTGAVVMARLTETLPDDPSGSPLRLLIAAGESIPAPNRFQGNSADVVIDGNAAHFVNMLVTQGFPHHTVLSWRDIRPELRRAAKILNIPVVEL